MVLNARSNCGKNPLRVGVRPMLAQQLPLPGTFAQKRNGTKSKIGRHFGRNDTWATYLLCMIIEWALPSFRPQGLELEASLTAFGAAEAFQPNSLTGAVELVYKGPFGRPERTASL